MKKQVSSVAAALAALLLLTGCTSTYMVTSYDDHLAATRQTKTALAEMGYEQSGAATRTDNNVHVSAVSYSTQTGFGTAMSNDYVTTDRFTYADSLGNTVDWCVSYRLHRSYDDILYVTDVAVPQCETSNPKEFERLCGPDSPIYNAAKASRSTAIEKTDWVKTGILIAMWAVGCAFTVLFL